MTDSPQTLPDMLDLVWRTLARAPADPMSAARLPVLATVGRDGGAEARTVVLRSVNRRDATAEAHTDVASTKIAEIEANALGMVHVWDADAMLQVRLRVRISILRDEDVRERWLALPEASHGNYGVTPPPGTAIDGPTTYTRVPDRARFAVLCMEIHEIDAVLLRDPHRRTLFRRSDGFTGTWLAP